MNGKQVFIWGMLASMGGIFVAILYTYYNCRMREVLKPPYKQAPKNSIAPYWPVLWWVVAFISWGWLCAMIGTALGY